MEGERDGAVVQVSRLTSTMEEVERHVVELATSISHLWDFRVKPEAFETKVTELESQIAKLDEERDETVKEKNKVVATGQKTAQLALKVALDAFDNGVEQVIVLNPRVSLRTAGANVN